MFCRIWTIVREKMRGAAVRIHRYEEWMFWPWNRFNALNYLNEPILVVSLKGKVLFVNTAFKKGRREAIPGNRPSRVLGKPVENAIRIDDESKERLYAFLGNRERDRVRELYLAAGEGGLMRISVVRRTNHFIIQIIHRRELNYQARHAPVEVSEVISRQAERTGAEAEQAALNEFMGANRFIEVFDSVEDLVHICDENFRIVYINQPMRKEFGDIVGEECFRAIYGFSEPCEGCQLKLLEEGRSFHYETYNEKVGRYYDILSTPYRAGDGKFFSISIKRDITKIKEEQKKARIFMNAIESTVNAVSICGIDGSIFYVNDAQAELFDTTKEKLLGQNIFAVYGLDLREWGSWDFYQTEKEMKRGADRLLILISIHSVKDPDGAITSLVCIAQDITSIKNLEIRFERERNYFKRIIDNSIDGFFIIDRDYKFIHTNKSFNDIFDLGERGPLGVTIHDLLSGNSKKFMMEKINAVFRRNVSESCEIEIGPADTTSRHYLISLNPLGDEKGNTASVYGFMKDISEIRRLHTIIENERNYNRSIIESVNLGFVLVDDKNEYLDYNAAYLKILDREEKDLVGKNFYDFTAQKYRKMQIEIMREIRETGRSQTFEKEFIRRDGSRVPVLVNMGRLLDREGSAIGSFAFIKDITDQKRIENQLIDKNIRILKLIDVYNNFSVQLLNALNVEDVYRGLISSMFGIISPESVEILLRSDGGFTSAYASNFTREDAGSLISPRASIVMKRILSSAAPVYIRDMKSEFIDEDIRLFPQMAKGGAAIFIPQSIRGEVSGVIVLHFLEDHYEIDNIMLNILSSVTNLASITIDKINSQLEQAEMKSALDRYEKLTVMGRIIAGVAHEINNPLSIMQFDLDDMRAIYENGDLTSAELGEIIKSMQEEIKRLSGIVTQLKDYSKPESRDEERVNVDEVLKGYPIKILIKNIKKKGIDVRMKLNTGKAVTRISRNRLIQVLMNLLNNADDAIEEKKQGLITVETWKVDKDGPRIAISIGDNGYGISPENMSHIFEPFFTTKKAEGTGLGLSVSYSIIKNYEGDIEVKSDGKSGSEFIIYFREDKA